MLWVRFDPFFPHYAAAQSRHSVVSCRSTAESRFHPRGGTKPIRDTSLMLSRTEETLGNLQTDRQVLSSSLLSSLQSRPRIFSESCLMKEDLVGYKRHT